ncbi:hypothetical protein LTR83_001939 [Exophiala xenobiotica]|nr:hypothetical protein LTR93_003920 [Exophiala xenobiotica]KAK5397932.1 hypothetical protein LTR79_004214 [Exophiala xenobiotica]KAK5417999.1 hypothetical protein LTR90_005173 [Exophiala xenobiotica]KAK5504014.1 hypothetical protein LTR83_001939 [Exophiala xenobiotica]
MTSQRSIAPILSTPVLDWESHKDIIEELYIKKDRPLGDVRQELEKWYTFEASIPQYKRKLKAWGFEKNHKSSEWQAIHRSLNRRSLDQTSARVTIKNSTLGPSKIERGLRRHVVPSLKRKWEALNSPDTPGHIRIVKAFPRELWGTRQLRGYLSAQAPASALGLFLASVVCAAPTLSGGRLAACRTPWAYRSPRFTSVPSRQSEQAHPEQSICKHNYVLREAIVNKQAAFCERLIGLGIDVDVGAPAGMFWSDGYEDQTTTALAARHLPEVARLIFRNHLRTFDRDRILFEAIEAGENGDEVCRLVSQGANVNCVDQRLRTPLHYAIDRQDGYLTKCLLENGARPDGATIESMEPTLRALWSDGEWQGDRVDFMTPLALAAGLTNLDLCDLLLEAGADLNLSIYDRLPQFFLDDNGDVIVDLVDTVSTKVLKDLDWTEVNRTTFLADYLYNDDKYREGAICFSTALEYAIRAESTAVVGLLLKRGVDLSVRYLTSPLVLASLQGQPESVELLLKCGANVGEVRGQRLRIDALQAASMAGSMCIAQQLIQAGADINSPTHGVQGLTALQWAAVRGDTDLLEYLLSHGADVNAPAATEHGYTALQAAVLFEREQVVNLLLNCGAEVNSSPSEVGGFTALSAAIYVENERLFWKLVKIGADVNLIEWEDCDNQNIHLLVAAKANTTNFVQWLLGLGVDIDMRLRSGYTLGEIALLRAVKAHRLTTVHLLLGRNSILSSKILTTALHSLGLQETGAWDVAYALLDRGADLRCQPQGFPNQTMLQKACTDDSLEHVQELVRRGADVNAPHPQDGGRTALQSAVKRGDLSTVEFLLDHGAFVNARPAEAWGRTALQAASGNGHVPVVELLLGHGANINAPSAPEGGRTALQAASENGYVPVVELLLGHGANINARPTEVWGRTALQAASENGHVPVVELLLGHGANINAQSASNGGRTALQAASLKGHVSVVELLLANGADVNAPACEQMGVTALQAAAIKGYVRIAQMLIAEGADVGAPPSPSEGRTALNGAAEHGRLDMVKLLLDNYRLKEDESFSKLCDEAAEYASRECHWGVVELLEGYQRGPNSSP